MKRWKWDLLLFWWIVWHRWLLSILWTKGFWELDSFRINRDLRLNRWVF